MSTKHEQVAAAMEDIERRGWRLEIKPQALPNGQPAHIAAVQDFGQSPMEWIARAARAKRTPLLGMSLAVARLDQGEAVIAAHAAMVAAHEVASQSGEDLIDAPAGIADWLQTVPTANRD